MRKRLPLATNQQLRCWLRSTARSHKRELSLVFLLLSGATIAGLVGPQVLGGIVGQVSRDPQGSHIDLLAFIFLITLAIQSVAKRFAESRARILSEQILAQTKESLIANALTLPLGEIEATGTGDLTNRATGDIEEIDSAMRSGAPEAVVALIGVLFITIAMLVTSPLLALGLLPSVPLLAGIAIWFSRGASTWDRQTAEVWADLRSEFYETAEGAETVEALNLAERRIQCTDHDIVRLAESNRILAKYRRVRDTYFSFSYVLPISMILLLGYWAYEQKWIDLGILTTMLLYAQLLGGLLNKFLRWLSGTGRFLVALRRVLGVQPQPIEVKSGHAPRTRDIALKEVRFAYSADREVLHGINLDIPQGEHLAIVGASGAGKSTLARLLSGTATPNVGSVRIGGLDVSTLSPDVLRREVLLLTQESHIFSGNLRENLTLPAGVWTDDELMAALNLVGADNWTQRLPDGLDTRVGPGALPVPLGIVQRIALARVILADPHTVILDEATSLLDRQSARALEQSLDTVLSGRTVIAIGHRLHTAAAADRIVVMKQGRIIELGTHEELLEAGGSYAHLVNAAGIRPSLQHQTSV